MCHWDTEYIEVTAITELYDVFVVVVVVVVDDDDDKDKTHSNLSVIGQDTDDSKGFFLTSKPTMWTWWEDALCFYYKLSVR